LIAAASVWSSCGSRWLEANSSDRPSGLNQAQVVRPRPVLIRVGSTIRGASAANG